MTRVTWEDYGWGSVEIGVWGDGVGIVFNARVWGRA
jgi:hypothetical protein